MVQIKDSNEEILEIADEVIVGFYNTHKQQVEVFRGTVVEFHPPRYLGDCAQVKIQLDKGDIPSYVYAYDWDKYVCSSIIKIKL